MVARRLLGVDRLLDMCRTVVSVTGDLAATVYGRERRQAGRDGPPPAKPGGCAPESDSPSGFDCTTVDVRMPPPTLVTRNVRVTVEAQFAPERSNVAKGVWFFVYTIVIKNEGQEPVQLLNRHWVITDAHGEVEEVRGAGVVGNQPRLSAGESFQYTSGCPLRTPFGSMHGSYEMTRDDGTRFEVLIPPFALRDPRMMQ